MARSQADFPYWARLVLRAHMADQLVQQVLWARVQLGLTAQLQAQQVIKARLVTQVQLAHKAFRVQLR